MSDVMFFIIVGISILLWGYAVYVCFDFIRTVQSRIDEKKSLKAINQRHFDEIFFQMCNQSGYISRIEKKIDVQNYKIQQIIDYINDNECSVKDDD